MSDKMSLRDAVYGNRSAISSACDVLGILARAFETTGQDKVSVQLWDIIDLIDPMSQNVVSAYQESIFERAAQAQADTLNLVEGITAAIEIGRKSKEP